jgi:dihydroorotate dehydrogenase
MAGIPYALARRFLRCFDPETAHGLSVRALGAGLAGADTAPDEPVLATRVFGLAFPNPVGLAAGFDKHAEVIAGCLGMGFGFVEAGTVTPLPQPGNPRPRLFRLDDDAAVINRFGFNSKGMAVYRVNLAAFRATGRPGLVGANVGKNRATEDGAVDYVACIEAIRGLADYIVCNVSSPNTPGLRGMQARAPIEDLLRRAIGARDRSTVDPARRPPLLAKVGPDLDEDQVRDIAEVALAVGVDGLIVGNTTVDRPPTLRSPLRDEAGGLSGVPLRPKADACLAAMYRLTGGKLPIIGCGGIASGADAYAKIRLGASLVQLYSALVFHGPGLVAAIKRDLAARLVADGFRSVADAVGIDAR